MADSVSKSESSALLGVLLATAGTMVTALGNHLIVKGHSFSKKQEHRQATLLIVAGNISVVLLGTVLGLVALAFAPQSIIAPLGGLTVIWNLVLATLPFFGGVKPKTEEIMYTCLTLFGMAMVVGMGPTSRAEKTSFATLVRPLFLVVLGTYVGLIVWLSSAKTENKLFRRIAAGGTGAMVGGLSNVFAKSAVEFYSGNQVESEAEDYVTFIVIIGIAVSLALGQLMLLNSALANFSAVQVIPIYQTILCIAATISGGIAFDEFRDMQVLQGLGFLVGVMVAAFGVLLSALRGSGVTIDNDKD